MEIIILISVIIYVFVGFAYISSFPKIGAPHEWLVNFILAFIWPHLMLKIFFKKKAYMNGQKMLKAKYEAEKAKKKSENV